MVNLLMLQPYGAQLVALLQIIGGGATEAILDELFSSTPARLVFIVMIISVVSMPVMLFIFLRILQRALDASAKNQDKLLVVIQDNQKYLNDAQEHNSENYLMLREYINQLQSTFNTVQASVVANQASMTANVNAVGDLLVQTTSLHAETRHDIQISFQEQISVALENILDQRRIDVFEDFQAPAEDDCRYKVRLIRAATAEGSPTTEVEPRNILLYKAPIFRDGNEAGRLRGSGEVVKIITDTVFPGWCYIKQMYGQGAGEDTRIAGYARLKSLSIIELPDVPINITG